MKKLISLLVIFVLAYIGFGANSRDSGVYREFATVDTAPGASGYFTNVVNPRAVKRNTGAGHLFFSNRGGGSMTVTLQNKRAGDASWIDYEDFTSDTVLVLDDYAAGSNWRAGVKNGEYTSGSNTFGFDW